MFGNEGFESKLTRKRFKKWWSGRSFAQAWRSRSVPSEAVRAVLGGLCGFGRSVRFQAEGNVPWRRAAPPSKEIAKDFPDSSLFLGQGRFVSSRQNTNKGESKERVTRKLFSL